MFMYQPYMPYFGYPHQNVNQVSVNKKKKDDEPKDKLKEKEEPKTE